LDATNPSIIPPFQGTGYWTNLSGSQDVFSNSLLFNSFVSGLSGGNSTFQWTVTKGNCSDQENVVINNSSVQAIASDQTECFGNIQLVGNNPSVLGGTGLWSLVVPIAGVSITTPSAYNSWVTGIPNNSSVSLQWAVYTTNCADSTTIIVRNNNFIVSAGVNDTTCGNSTQLNGDTPGTGTGYWELVVGDGVFGNSSDNQSWVYDLGTGDNVFRWTIERNGCSNNSTVLVRSDSIYPVNITGPLNTETCNGSVTLTASVPTGSAVGHWEQISGTGTFVGSSANNPLTVTNLSPGNNLFY